MKRYNLVLMGLRGLLLEIIREYRDHQGDASLVRILQLMHLPERPLNGNLLDITNAIASAAEDACIEDEMKEAAKWALLDGKPDLEGLLSLFQPQLDERPSTLH